MSFADAIRISGFVRSGHWGTLIRESSLCTSYAAEEQPPECGTCQRECSEDNTVTPSIATPSIRHVALIGNFPPRRCGIATFSADLKSALTGAKPSLRLSLIAMNDPGQQHAYPPTVGYEIGQNQPESYLAAAEHINALNPDIVSIQHEFGIFGGAAGEYLLKLVEPLRAPVVTTLHTVVSSPTEEQRRVVQALAHHSSRLVVMTAMGQEILIGTWGMPRQKIAVIPHGIPDLPFLDPAIHKDRFGLEGCKVVLTFGLLSLVLADFENRHREVRQVFEQRYDSIARELDLPGPLRGTSER